MAVVFPFPAARSGPDMVSPVQTDPVLLSADARGGARRARAVRYFRDSHGREYAAVRDLVWGDPSGCHARAVHAAVACTDR